MTEEKPDDRSYIAIKSSDGAMATIPADLYIVYLARNLVEVWSLKRMRDLDDEIVKDWIANEGEETQQAGQEPK